MILAYDNVVSIDLMLDAVIIFKFSGIVVLTIKVIEAVNNAH